MATRLYVGATLRRAVGLVRAEWRILITLALLVEVPALLAEAAGTRLLDIEVDTVVAIETIAALLLLFAWTTLAHHVLIAAAERVEAARRQRQPRVDLRTVLRGFPFARVLVADVAVTLATVAGLVLLVVPGVVVTVWTAPLFPLLTMERRPLIATLRRSLQLVHGNAWRVLVVLGVVVLAAQASGLAVAAVLHGAPVFDAIAHFAVVLAFAPVAAAAVVVATFELVAVDAARRRTPATV